MAKVTKKVTKKRVKKTIRNNAADTVDIGKTDLNSFFSW